MFYSKLPCYDLNDIFAGKKIKPSNPTIGK